MGSKMAGRKAAVVGVETMGVAVGGWDFSGNAVDDGACVGVVVIGIWLATRRGATVGLCTLLFVGVVLLDGLQAEPVIITPNRKMIGRRWLVFIISVYACLEILIFGG
jgi:hypothetical protein